jgi:hypothetical protein
VKEVQFKCRYALYEECEFYVRTGEIPTQKDCMLCLKAYRLRHGLKTVFVFRGVRSGITL